MPGRGPDACRPLKTRGHVVPIGQGASTGDNLDASDLHTTTGRGAYSHTRPGCATQGRQSTQSLLHGVADLDDDAAVVADPDRPVQLLLSQRGSLDRTHRHTSRGLHDNGGTA